MEELIAKRIKESIDVKKGLLNDSDFLDILSRLSEAIANAFRKGQRLILCGNGGSASDALHFAGEMVGRFQLERQAWSVIVLNSDVATMTAVANDYGYDNVFARQAEGHVREGDVFIGISTSGNSENVYRAIKTAREKGAIVGALLGKDGGRIKDAVEYPLVVPSNCTARIQECHILLIHIICEIVEERLK